jgi:hypothetical protein
MTSERLRKNLWLMFVCAMLSILLAACDVHHEKLIGPYFLGDIDVTEQMSVFYDLGDGSGIGRIGPTVFSVGWNDRYIVAKEHPNGDKRITNFYYLEIARDSKYADPKQSVTDPLTKVEFLEKQKALNLPQFTRTIKSLE